MPFYNKVDDLFIINFYLISLVIMYTYFFCLVVMLEPGFDIAPIHLDRGLSWAFGAIAKLAAKWPDLPKRTLV